MSITTENSDLLANNAARPPVQNATHLSRGRMRIQRFRFTQGSAAGDANSLQNLCKLPAGNVTVLLALSRIAWSAMGTARTLDIGTLAYVDQAGDAVAAAADVFDADIDVSSVGVATLGSDFATEPNDPVFQSRNGVTIQSKIVAGTIPAAATLFGYIVYIQD